MDQHHHTAPEHVRERIRIAGAETTYRNTDGTTVSVPALGWIAAIRCALRAGYVVPASEIPTPAHDELARLGREEPTRLGRFRAAHSLDLQYERQARQEAENAERTVPAMHAQQAAACVEHEAKERRAAIERRADEILAVDEAAALEKRRAKARATAEKEAAEGAAS